MKKDNEKKAGRVIFFLVMFIIGVFAFMISIASCTQPKLIGTGYHIVIEEPPRMVWVEKEKTVEKADSCVYKITGLKLKTDSLISDQIPAYRFYNWQWDVYVEEKGIYKRRENSREIWRRLK